MDIEERRLYEEQAGLRVSHTKPFKRGEHCSYCLRPCAISVATIHPAHVCRVCECVKGMLDRRVKDGHSGVKSKRVEGGVPNENPHEHREAAP